MIAGKSIEEWKSEIPVLEKMIRYEEVFWENEKTVPFEKAMRNMPLGMVQMEEACLLLERFAPYISEAFPETAKDRGLIESPLTSVPRMKAALGELLGHSMDGGLMLKRDSHLPISGSIKARGGIFEVLKHAERIAAEAGMLNRHDDYSVLSEDRFRDLFSNHAVSVGSTGNLGLSIGIMGAELGFRVTVHMSSDARQWKKELLRARGVDVVEYASDYGKAVEEGRKIARSEANNHFIDDENSTDLFLGYSVAAPRLKTRLDSMGITVNPQNPLFVYLPCGVGGGPGGVAFGLKMMYGDSVHVFFAEPTHSPCMMLGVMTGKHDGICVGDFGIDNRTAADGLAVGRPSSFIGKTLGSSINGFFSVSDSLMLKLLSILADCENLRLEPSALAGMAALYNFFEAGGFENYTSRRSIASSCVTHLVWATGGSMVPEDIMAEYYLAGKAEQVLNPL